MTTIEYYKNNIQGNVFNVNFNSINYNLCEVVDKKAIVRWVNENEHGKEQAEHELYNIDAIINYIKIDEWVINKALSRKRKLDKILNKMKVLILESPDGDWEGLYINGTLINEDEVLGEGDSRLYMLRMAEEHGFKSSDIEVKELSEADATRLRSFGSMEENLSDYSTKY